MNRIFFLILVIAFSITGYSQRKDITVKEYFSDAEYFFIAEEFEDAFQEYLEVYRRGYQENAYINYQMGVCYLNMPGQKEKAIPFLLNACQNISSKFVGGSLQEIYAPLDAYLYLGNAYRITEDLDKAVSSYNLYLEQLSETAKEERTYAKKQIEACYIANEFISNPHPVSFTSISSLVNNNYSNHNCVISVDGTTMVYMTKLPFYEAVFMSTRRGNNWSRPENITPQIMSDGDQFVTGISSDGQKLLLAKADEFDSDIYISEYVNGQWTKSRPIGKTINSRYWESHASFSADGKQLYFTSNRRESMGGMDIFVSDLLENGEWSEPVNLGPYVNTALNEDTPFISSDGHSLYYSSQGHMNMGGYDIFVCHMTDSGWGGPENLGYPISTTDEDMFYFPGNDGESAVIERIFTTGAGSWDIYELTYVDEELAEQEIAENIEEDIDEEEALQNQVPATGITEFNSEPIYFGFDNYSIGSDAGRQIAPFVRLLKNNPEMNASVIGYTDALGPDEYNLKLSERRAVAVMKYLEAQGIESGRLKAVGKGETNFIAINANPDGSDNPDGRTYNRRVEIELSGYNMEEITVIKATNVPDNLAIKK